uniref:Uncharacterized protein n=1 Tax=Triticum urartu TaxID=4572 RepID=A0A8R7VAT3_TRIUA
MQLFLGFPYKRIYSAQLSLPSVLTASPMDPQIDEPRASGRDPHHLTSSKRP